jgi:hypothetical protein
MASGQMKRKPPWTLFLEALAAIYCHIPVVFVVWYILRCGLRIDKKDPPLLSMMPCFLPGISLEIYKRKFLSCWRWV